MRILLVRHAIAEDLEQAAGGGGDAGRRLTKRGREKMRAAAAGLRRAVDAIDVLASSPLVRAVETAEIIRKAYDRRITVARIAVLKPGKPVKAVLAWMQGQPADATIALVGHEPQLGMLASWLLSGEQRSFVAFRKGGACLLEFAGTVRAARATMLWMLKPAQLTALGK